MVSNVNYLKENEKITVSITPYNLRKDNNLKLIIDETYKNFGNKQSNILYEGKWDEHIIQLYSFSKVYRLTGHRVGLMEATRSIIKQVEKLLDTTTICPNR